MRLSKKIQIIFLPALVAALNIFIIIFPRESLAAARDGLNLWVVNVLPGVLPFVIGANLLMALGAVNMLGAALAPVMKSVFKVPGVGGFALAIGLVSGYPVGAKVVAEMRQNGDINRVQAQRLAAFTNNAGPLFILGAVAGGLFGSIALGYFLLVAHYVGTLVVGILMRFYGRKYDADRDDEGEKQYPLHIRAYRSMAAVQRKDGRGFGHIFGQAVANAVETMLLIGGFIVLFSVISAILSLMGVYTALGGIFAPFFEFFGTDINDGFFAGLVEMTNGLGKISQAGISRGTVTLAAAVLGFGGASIMFQSINFLSKTDVKTMLYVACKAAHGIISAAFAASFYPMFENMFVNEEAAAVYSHSIGVAARFAQSAAFFGIIVAVLGILSLAIILKRKKIKM